MKNIQTIIWFTLESYICEQYFARSQRVNNPILILRLISFSELQIAGEICSFPNVNVLAGSTIPLWEKSHDNHRFWYSL